MDNNQNITPNAPRIEQKNIAVCIILSIITCGIYGYYWLYTLTEDMKTLSGDTTGASGGMAIILTIVTCGIYQLYWMYKQGERLDTVKTQRGLPSSNSGIIYLILSLVAMYIISYALIQNEINKLA